MKNGKLNIVEEFIVLWVTAMTVLGLLSMGYLVIVNIQAYYGNLALFTFLSIVGIELGVLSKIL